MHCKNCGAEVTENFEFCPKCGSKIGEETISANGELIQTQISKKTIRDFWNKLSKFGKSLVIFTAIFSLFFLIAVFQNKTAASVFSFIQIVLCVISLLIINNKIRVHRKRLHIILSAIALILIFPYIAVSNSSPSSAEKFVWNNIVLNEILPKPEPNFGEIISNDSDGFLIYIYKTSNDYYKEYIAKCEEKGFNIDSYKSENSYVSYNRDGYKLNLSYNFDDKKLCIDLDAPIKFGEINWSDSEIAKLIPIPEFTSGKIVKDDISEFTVYLGGVSYDEYEKYVGECSDIGFNADSNKAERTFSAKNSDDHILTVNYEGNNVIYISIKDPEYDIDIDVEYVNKLFDSEYDVDIYIDDNKEGVIKHAATNTYSATLSKGIHTIKFVNSYDNSITNSVKITISKKETLKFKITCTENEISTETLAGDVEVEVKAIKFTGSSEITLQSLTSSKRNSFSLETNSNKSITNYNELVDFISENPEVATIKYDENSSSSPSVIIMPVGVGETYVYIQSKDNSVKSEKIKVIVEEKKTEPVTEPIPEPEPETTKSTYSETTNSYSEPITENRSGRIVYITPTGKKYHYSKSCAGKNAIEKDINNVQGAYGPCKKCVG